MVDLADYAITSNRESGYGRYDIMLKPKEGKNLPAIIIEFKVHDSNDGKDLVATVLTAITEGVSKENIREYGFAFEKKTVLIDGDDRQKVDSMIKSAEKVAAKKGTARKSVGKAAAKKVTVKKKTVRRKRDVKEEDNAK
mgnify:CR=1 FL=1